MEFIWSTIFFKSGISALFIEEPDLQAYRACLNTTEKKFQIAFPHSRTTQSLKTVLLEE